MTGTILGNNGILLTSSQEFKEQLANNLFRLISVGRAPIASRTLTSPPGSVSPDSYYIVPSGATGAWANKTNQIAYPVLGANGQPASGSWAFWIPFAGLKVALVDGVELVFNGTQWENFAGSADMRKAVYDTDDDGIVDEAEAIAGNPSDNTVYGKQSGSKGFFGALSWLLTGLSTTTGGAIAATDTILQALGKLQNQINNVTSTLLTGLSTATGGVITATDSILQALGKLQNQVTDRARITASNDFTVQQRFPLVTLTDGATISWNLNTQQVAQVTLGGNRTLAAPTNQQAGGTYVLIVRQDGTGSRTLTLNSVYKFSATPTLSTAANSIDIFSFVSDGTSLFGSVSKGYL